MGLFAEAVFGYKDNLVCRQILVLADHLLNPDHIRCAAWRSGLYSDDGLVTRGFRTQNRIDLTLVTGEPIRNHRGLFYRRTVSEVLVDDRDDFLEQIAARRHSVSIGMT